MSTVPGVLGRDSLMSRLISWFLRASVLGGLVLVLLALASAIAVVAVSHTNRQMYGELQKLQYARDSLDSEYGKLLLEQSVWAEYSKVEELSIDKLAMQPVNPDVTVIIREGVIEKRMMSQGKSAFSPGQ